MSIKIVKSSCSHNIEIAEQGAPRLKTQVVIQNLRVKDESFLANLQNKNDTNFLKCLKSNRKKADFLSYLLAPSTQAGRKIQSPQTVMFMDFAIIIFSRWVGLQGFEPWTR